VIFSNILDLTAYMLDIYKHLQH